MLRSVQPRHAGKGDDCVGRRGLLHIFKELLLIGMTLNLWEHPLRMAELGDPLHIGASFLVPLGQYGDSVHSLPPFGFVALVGISIQERAFFAIGLARKSR